ncbi:hypothetical protein FZC76_18125 [Sutcliffiella horikoshii]|uniref:Uncharacterized protein n=1 Tax=Sutcliffiella horikoshii TaxID=79883 RepID=A0A5D4SMJ6_9BACI|nr:hypothetical protein [Sutcliffiella horikoshii]TYS64480.1 hypothetical protein FZC76_18125 [Sutcliffiella horikoshii]
MGIMVSFRLNDDTIISRIEQIPKQFRSSEYRNALTQYFTGKPQQSVLHVLQETRNVPQIKIDLLEKDKEKNPVNLDEALDRTLDNFF